MEACSQSHQTVVAFSRVDAFHVVSRFLLLILISAATVGKHFRRQNLFTPLSDANFTQAMESITNMEEVCHYRWQEAPEREAIQCNTMTPAEITGTRGSVEKENARESSFSISLILSLSVRLLFSLSTIALFHCRHSSLCLREEMQVIIHVII